MKNPSTLLKVVFAAASVAAGSLYVSAQLAPAKTTESKRPSTKLTDGNRTSSADRGTGMTTGDGSGSTASPARAQGDPQARDIGTVNVNVASNQSANGTRRGEIDQGEVVIPLHRESMNVEKRVVDDGAVRLRKVVRTEEVHQPVELRREMIVVERVGQNDQNRPTEATNGIPGTFEEGEIVIPIAREEPVVNKQIQVADRVVARTDIETDRRDVRENVRTETVEFIDRGDPNRVRVIGDIAETRTQTPAKNPEVLESAPSEQVVRHAPQRP
ncbi:MAG TPA: YsnF/AvaK domain-containing protein [Opitutaceae bacterium]